MHPPPDDPAFTNEQDWMQTGWMRKAQPAPFAEPASAPAEHTEPEPSRFLIDWVDQHRESTHPADPTYPEGCAIDVALDAAQACRLELPWPAARCGLWVITCRACGFAISLTTAGRPDDPRTLRLPCRV